MVEKISCSAFIVSECSAPFQICARRSLSISCGPHARRVWGIFPYSLKLRGQDVTRGSEILISSYRSIYSSSIKWDTASRLHLSPTREQSSNPANALTKSLIANLHHNCVRWNYECISWIKRKERM